MAASLSQAEGEEKLHLGLESKVPGEPGLEEEHQPEEEHQKERQAHALRTLLLARRKEAGLVSPEGNTRTTCLLHAYCVLAISIKRVYETSETTRS